MERLFDQYSVDKAFIIVMRHISEANPTNAEQILRHFSRTVAFLNCRSRRLDSAPTGSPTGLPTGSNHFKNAIVEDVNEIRIALDADPSRQHNLYIRVAAFLATQLLKRSTADERCNRVVEMQSC